GELVARLRLAPGERASVLLADPALLLGELRDRVGACACERPLELLRTVGGLLVDHRADATLGLRVVGIELPPAPDEPREPDGGEHRQRAPGKARGRYRERELGLERERDPCRDRGAADERRCDGRRAAREPAVR